MSHQHREVQPGRIKRDNKDLQTFLHFLNDHNPFAVDNKDQIRNIATGFIADDCVNVDEAILIGTKINENFTGKKYNDVVLKRSDQATTFAAMRKPLKLKGSVEVHMSSISQVVQETF